MLAQLGEGPVERLDVGIGEVAREVLLDAVPMVEPRLLHRRPALVGEDDED